MEATTRNQDYLYLPDPIYAHTSMSSMRGIQTKTRCTKKLYIIDIHMLLPSKHNNHHGMQRNSARDLSGICIIFNLAIAASTSQLGHWVVTGFRSHGPATLRWMKRHAQEFYIARRARPR